MDFERLVRVVLEGYALDPRGLHGVAHWARVFENGCRLCDEMKVSRDVITLFAVFHDSRRANEGHDPEHGSRGALLAEQFRGQQFDISDADFERLQFACTWHTSKKYHDDTIIQCCWDADRLDLGRVGVVPDRRFLNTSAAKQKGILDWAYGRGAMHVVPTWIQHLVDDQSLPGRNNDGSR